MKTINRIARAIHLPTSFTAFLSVVITLLIGFSPITAKAQAVTSIITDYNGFWKSSATIPNAVKPDNSHNLLAFGYNGQQYSTGVNDELLASRGESFIVGDFWALPVGTLNGTITSNTKAGFGAMYDGVFNGRSTPAPEYGISMYLTDGIKGLNLGTCIANLPAGYMTFTISNIQPTAIGDGIPDILVTQVADPSGTYDRYSFTDANGVRVGNYKDIVFTNIAPVGNWTADFYEASTNPFTLAAGFTQTDRALRMWAADLSELGITQSNYMQVRNFRIDLAGQSDVAFVAYNNTSVTFQRPLPVQYAYFNGTATGNGVQLSWETVSEQAADKFVVERSTNGADFTAIGTVRATNKATTASDYHFTDGNAPAGKCFYRLRQVDLKGGYTNSTIIRVNTAAACAIALEIYPNPAHDAVRAVHAQAAGSETLCIYNAAGVMMSRQRLAKNTTQTSVSLKGATAGSYFMMLDNGRDKTIVQFVVK